MGCSMGEDCLQLDLLFALWMDFGWSSLVSGPRMVPGARLIQQLLSLVQMQFRLSYMFMIDSTFV